MSESITGSVVADRYRVTGFLRSGRMGDIYVARRLDDDRKVSIKVLDPGLFDNEEAVKRFERETRVTRTIDHPCSMRVLDYGRSASGPFLVMEHVEGELLSDLIDEKGALEPERAARIAARIAMALGAAHDAGVIHRDLAPSNVLVARQGGRDDLVKVTDFGLSLLTHEGEDEAENTNLTAVGVRIGTPTYMAPEYIEEYELDHRADLYGLGVMLFEMLTGSPPFTGRPYKVMEAHVSAPMPAPSSKRPGVPPWLDALVLSLTEKDPKKRPQKAQEVVQRIEAGLGATVEVVEYVAPTAEPAPVRAAAPAAPAADPILSHFVQTNLQRVERAQAHPPAPSRCFVVDRVSEASIAGQLGVRPGWRVHLPEEDEGDGLLEPRLHRRAVRERTWHFYPPDRAERVALTATGVPVGVELVRSPENVVAAYDPLLPEADALLDLWKQGRWEELGKLSFRTVTQQKGAAGLLATGLFARFLGSDKPKLLDHPALLFLGAAEIEQGRFAEGVRHVTEFKAKYAQKWPAVYHAIACYSLAKDKLRTGAKDLAADLLSQSLALRPLPPAVALATELHGEPPAIAPWVGRTFSDYSMDATDGRGSAKLSETLSRMDASQLHAICLMGGYRGNPDYDDFMHRWASYAAWFGEFLAGLHVVTTATEREADKPEHYAGEDFVRAAGLELMVLHDYRAFVQRAIKPPNIPTLYLVDRAGTCVHEGWLSPCDLWDALALAGRLRVERMQGERR